MAIIGDFYIVCVGDDITKLNDVVHGDIVNRLFRGPRAAYRQAEQREH